LLYWYKSTRFTGTKVVDMARGSLLREQVLRLLYWYKSTNADAARSRNDIEFHLNDPKVLQDMSDLGGSAERSFTPPQVLA
jgi:hypothetical protein